MPGPAACQDRRAGCRSLAVINFTPAGVLPHWHRPTDTVENIDPDVFDRTEQFVSALLQHLDRAPEAQPSSRDAL